MNPIRLDLTTEMFDTLALHFSGARKSLSPLIPVAHSSSAIDQQLVQAGILDLNNQIKAPFNDMLTNLAETQIALDLDQNYLGVEKHISLYSPKSIYSSNLFAPTCIRAGDPDRVILESPFNKQDLDVVLQPLLELGDGQNTSFHTELKVDEALVLATLMDLQRQSNGIQMKKSPKSETQKQKPWNPNNILKALQKPGGADASLWAFSTPLIALIPIQKWSQAKVQSLLNSLEKSGLLFQPKKADYSFSDSMSSLVGHFSNFGKTFWLSVKRTGEKEDLSLIEEEHIGYCSQGMNLVFSAKDSENLQIQTLSKMQITDMIAQEIFPTVLPSLQAPVIPLSGKAAKSIRKKKKSLAGLIVGLTVLLIIALLLVLFGAGLLANIIQIAF